MSETTTPTFSASENSLEQLARAGFDGVYVDPRLAEQQLRTVLERAVPDDPASVRAGVVAMWGLGRLHHSAGAYDAAVSVFESAIAAAVAAGLGDDLAQIRISAAVTFQSIGDGERALLELDLAAGSQSGSAHGRWAGQRALVLHNLGRTQEALRAFDEAVGVLTECNDTVALARTHVNRAVAHLQQSAYPAARSDLLRARALAGQVGEHVVVATALHNLGYLDACAGNIPAALRSYDEARDAYRALGSSGRLVAELDADHAELCLAVGLAPEALMIADRLIADSTAGNLLQLGAARLIRTRALSLLGDFPRAAEEATAAERLLVANDRLPWAAIAGYLGVVAAWRARAADDDADALLDRLERVAGNLEVHGWRNEVAEVRTVQGRLAIERGALTAARRYLIQAGRVRRHATASHRAQAALARALLHEADGNAMAALDQARRGLDAVDGQRAGLGSSELRAATSAAAVPLVELGLRITIAQNRPGAALRWAERGRAAALTAPPTEPPDDPALASALTELRELHAARRDGQAIDARLAEVELDILRRRRLDAGDPDTAAGRLSISAIRARLGDAVLVEYIERAGILHAVVVDHRRSAIVAIGAMADIEASIDHLLFSLRRLSMLPAGHPRQAAIRAALAHAADELDRLLLGPINRRGTAGVVAVPTGRLHDVPWMTLPTARRTSLLVAPSATWWMRSADRDHHDGRRVAIVGGPELEHVDAELDDLAAIYGRDSVVDGSAATVATVLQRLGSADIAHIAAHGHFRADSPMFSSLQMVDGPLNIHDLQSLRRVPRLVVLTACDAGRSGVLAGDELLGTVAALLSLGVATVVAPLLPIADQPAARIAVALHRQMVAGRAPADALAQVATDAERGEDAALAAAAMSFLCIGTHDSGFARISPASRLSVRRHERHPHAVQHRPGPVPIGADG